MAYVYFSYLTSAPFFTYSSIIMCAFVPPAPNELIPALNGTPGALDSNGIGPPTGKAIIGSKVTSGRRVLKLMFGGMVFWETVRAAFMNSVMPAAPSE